MCKKSFDGKKSNSWLQDTCSRKCIGIANYIKESNNTFIYKNIIQHKKGKKKVWQQQVDKSLADNDFKYFRFN